MKLPGIADTAEARRVIQAGGQLDLRLVNDPQTYPSVAASMAQHTVLPAGDDLVPACADNRDRATGSNTGELFSMPNRAPITPATALRSAPETRRTTTPD